MNTLTVEAKKVIIKRNYIRKAITPVSSSLMTKPVSIIIEDKTFYRSEELYKYDSIYFLGFARMRNLITKKNMKSEDYMFAYLKKNDWIISNKDYKTAKFLISENWVLDNVTKMKPDYSIDDIQEYSELPNLLILDNDEKFKDKNGNVLEIEVRGTKKHNLCYFKVKDIGMVFGMPNIDSTLNNKNGYRRGIDFKCFIKSKEGKVDPSHRNSKTLFLTYLGIRKTINTNRNRNIDSKVAHTMNKWLQQFDNDDLKNFLIPDTEQLSLKVGYLYCVTSPIINGIKIGFWTGDLSGLRCRYVTYYGIDLQLETVYTTYPRTLECICHNEFKKYNIANEIFDKRYLKEYLFFLEKNKTI
jgi:hypothetical protein